MTGNRKHSGKSEYYEKLKYSIRNLYPEGLSDAEAEEATRNLIRFAKLLLEPNRPEQVKSKGEQTF